MRARFSPAMAVGIGFLMVFLAGCTPSEASREILLTFDGNNCLYEGPEKVSAGDVTIRINNLSELDPSFWIVRIEAGKSWQDMLDYIGPPGSNIHPPEWSAGNILMAPVPDDPDARVYTFKEGLYAICCCTCYDIQGPHGVWPGAGLEVTGTSPP